MIEKEMLDLIAAQAPAPVPDFAEDVLRRARRVRRRRLATAATGVLTAGAVVSFSLLTGGGDPEPRKERVIPAQPPARIQTEAQVYAAAIKALTDENSGSPRARPRVLYVLDHLCADPAGMTRDRCDGASLPAGLRTDLTGALASYVPVSYLPDPRTVTKKDTSIANDGAVITLGPVRIKSDTAQLAISIRRDGLDGRGQTYQMALRAGRWTVMSKNGPGWIS